MRFARPQVLGLLLSLLSGCGSTQYKPIKSPRVSYVSGSFVRDGMTYPEGLGGGLVQAVRGNPRAEAEARAARSLAIGGVVCLGGAVVGLGVGAGLVVAGAKEDESGDPKSQTMIAAGGAVMIGALALDIVALVLLSHANARGHDALNIYNDGVELRRPPPEPLVGPRAELVR